MPPPPPPHPMTPFHLLPAHMPASSTPHHAPTPVFHLQSDAVSSSSTDHPMGVTSAPSLSASKIVSALHAPHVVPHALPHPLSMVHHGPAIKSPAKPLPAVRQSLRIRTLPTASHPAMMPTSHVPVSSTYGAHGAVLHLAAPSATATSDMTTTSKASRKRKVADLVASPATPATPAAAASSVLSLSPATSSPSLSPSSSSGSRKKAAVQMSRDEAKAAFAQMFHPKAKRVDTEAFYGRLDGMATAHRQSLATAVSAGAASEAQQFVTLMEHDEFRDIVHDHVRVTATKDKRVGETRGTGLDELLKTSYTLEWFKRSAGMVQGVSPVAVIAGQTEPLSWIRVQQYLRAVTSDVIFKGGMGAHVGALFEAAEGRGGQLTKGQPEFHQIRNDRILATSNPHAALLEAIKAHVQLTANAADLHANLNRNAYDPRQRSAAVPAERTAMIEHYLRIRDQFKLLREEKGGRSASLSPVRSKAKHEQLNTANVPAGSYWENVPVWKVFRGWGAPRAKATARGRAKTKAKGGGTG